MPIDPFVAAATPAAPDPFVAAATPAPQAQADPYVAAATSRPQTDPFVAAATRPTAAPLAVKSTVDLGNLQPDLRDALYAAAGDLSKKGIDISTYVTSGFRTRAQQQHEWDRKQAGLNPYPVAKPGTSPHEFGRAIDIGIGRIPADQRQTVIDTLAQHGLVRNVAHDPVHFQLARGIAQGMSEGYQAPQQDGPQWPSLGHVAWEGIKSIPESALIGFEHLIAGAGAAAGTALSDNISQAPAAFMQALHNPNPMPVSSAFDAAVNTFARQTLGNPELAGDFPNLPSVLSDALHQAFEAGKTAYSSPQEAPPGHPIRQRIPDDAPAITRALASLGDLGLQTLNPSVALQGEVLGPILGPALKAVGASGPVQAALGKANEVFNPYYPTEAATWAQTQGRKLAGGSVLAGKGIADFLGGLGIGPNQALKNEAVAPMLNAQGADKQNLQDIVNFLAQRTTAAQTANPQWNAAVEAYQASHEGANPVFELVRRAVGERASVTDPHEIVNLVGRAKAGDNAAGMALAEVHVRYNNPYGVDPLAIAAAADAINGNLNRIEGRMRGLQFGPSADKALAQTAARAANPTDFQPANENWGQFGGNKTAPEPLAQDQVLAHEETPPPAPEPPLLDRKKALDGIFGEAPTDVRKPGVVRKGTNIAGIAEIKQTAIGEMMQKLAADGDYVQPIPADGTLRPGWTAISDNASEFGPLAGKQVPTVLANLIEKGSGEPTDSEYIAWRNLGDVIRKNTVGFVKRGIVTNPVTQIADIANHDIAARAGLRVYGDQGNGLVDDVIQAAKDLKLSKEQGLPPEDVRTLRKYTRSFDQTLASTVDTSYRDSPALQTNKVVFINGKGVTPLTERVPPGVVPAAANVAKTVINRVPEFAMEFHQNAEQAYKLAMFRRLAPKIGDEAASKAVEKYLFDFNDRGVILQALDRYGLWPFNAWPTKSLKLGLETLVNEPEQVAKYARLRQIAYQGQDTSQLKPEQRGPFSVPIGPNEVADLRRFTPFGDAMAGAQALKRNPSLGGLAQGGLAALGLVRPGEDLLTSLGSRSVFAGPAAALFFGNRLANQEDRTSGTEPLLQPGQAPSELNHAKAAEIIKDLAPTLFMSPSALARMLTGREVSDNLSGRGSEAIASAAEGKSPSDSKFSEPRPLEDVLAQYLLGLRTTKGEEGIAKKQRVGPTIGAHAEVGGDFLSQAVTAAPAGPANPFADRVQGMTDLLAVNGQWKQAQSDGKKMVADPRFVVNGQPTEEGRRLLLAQANWIKALGWRAGQLSAARSAR